MRIPGWLIFTVGFVLFVGSTALCSVLSYATTRDMVVDARGSGMDVPSVSHLVDYALNGAEEKSGLYIPDDSATISPTIAAATPWQSSYTPPPGGDTPAPMITAAPTQPPDLLADLVITDPRRITVLLMGIDQRRAMTDYTPAYRTDTMILAQVDPIRHTIGVLSIPRDLFVTIPGFESGRIATANFLGDSNAVPGGGPQLAMETVRANLGVPVDNYVRINFDVFLSIVNTVAPDGVEICINETIEDPTYPDAGTGFIHVHFDPGCQILDAERLLQYARTRATAGGDFDRNRRQQEVLQALQAEVLSVGGITNFITQIPSLYQQLAGSYSTNLSLTEILELAQLVGTIPQENITFRAINTLHVRPDTTAENEQVLIPIQNQIRFIVQDTFDPQRDLSLAELRQRAETEDAQIVIINNTSVVGLAARTREWLTAQGVEIFEVGDAVGGPTNAPEITIQDHTGNPWTARYLAALLGLSEDAILPGESGQTASDIRIILGTDTVAFLEQQGMPMPTPLP